MNNKELREKAIKRYKNVKSSKEIISLGKVRTLFLNSLSVPCVMEKLTENLKIVNSRTLLIFYQKTLLIYQGSISRVRYV